jgi:hypothetical protein
MRRSCDVLDHVSGMSIKIVEDGDWVEHHTPWFSLCWIAGLRIRPDDQARAIQARRLRPDDADRHDELADGMRSAAGRECLQIGDVMVRARMLDHVDGWSGVVGQLIERTDEGELWTHKSEDFVSHILIVRCPSTGRRYALNVGLEHQTVAEARRWVNRGLSPTVET